MGVYDSPCKMLKLRNPWGKKEWQGRGSDKDYEFWSQLSFREKEEVGFKDKNEGIFFITWDEFLEYFGMFDICKINENANYLCAEAEFDRHNGEMFEF